MGMKIMKDGGGTTCTLAFHLRFFSLHRFLFYNWCGIQFFIYDLILNKCYWLCSVNKHTFLHQGFQSYHYHIGTNTFRDQNWQSLHLDNFLAQGEYNHLDADDSYPYLSLFHRPYFHCFRPSHIYRFRFLLKKLNFTAMWQRWKNGSLKTKKRLTK